jgi:hypothetical protein
MFAERLYLGGKENLCELPFPKLNPPLMAKAQDTVSAWPSDTDLFAFDRDPDQGGISGAELMRRLRKLLPKR